MKELHIVRAVAISLVLLVLINFVGSIVVSGDERLVSNSIGLIVVCVTAFFLTRGASWARWLTVIFCALGVVLGIVTAFALLGSEFNHKIADGVWAVTGVIFNTIIVGLLAFSTRISHFFLPSTLRSRVCIGLIVAGLLIFLGILTYFDIRDMHDSTESVTRASYICYGTYNKERASCLEIKEIWKAPSTNESKLTVGSELFSNLFNFKGSDHSPTGAIVFLHQDPNTLKAKLPPFRVLAVYEDRVADTKQTLLEFKRSCGLQKQDSGILGPESK